MEFNAEISTSNFDGFVYLVVLKADISNVVLQC